MTILRNLEKEHGVKSAESFTYPAKTEGTAQWEHSNTTKKKRLTDGGGTGITHPWVMTIQGRGRRLLLGQDQGPPATGGPGGVEKMRK